MHTQWISRLAMAVLWTAGFALAAVDASAQNFPNKPITFVVPYGPGTGIDVIARIVAQKVSETWTSPMVVENRPGATGGIAMELVAKAPPDGYTLAIAGTSQIVNQLASKARYDMVKDFAPVSLSGNLPYVMAVANSLPAKSVNELVALAKSRPGKINYAGTTGGVPHFMGEMLKSARNIDIVMIPYKSTTDAQADVTSGRIDIWFTTLASALPQVKAGKVRVLGVTGEKRAAVLPDVPTMVEAGVPAIDISVSFFILAPAATPKPVVNALNAEIVKAMATKEVRDRLAAAGVEPESSTPEGIDARLKSELARWAKIIKESGVRIE